ncbi:endonuclease V [Filibacter tadaridae]|uniref:Endonuclease V n=1 Tax=Filibacter tadaridae TaxID=2483811 RepID=A0A3P5XBM7_9BACL|nr:endonuclease V [Filibacter tadaridae]VDC24904.1 Endonuclease V [Filibacter tadaridae]
MNNEEKQSLSIEIEKFKTIQTFLSDKISLKNGRAVERIQFCAGVDVAYWEEAGVEWGVCSIVVIDYDTKVVVDKTHSIGKITVPYIPGYLAFRELPLVLDAAKKLSKTPDLYMFDGNGYLHPRHMGIATHASFFLNKPTIGIAKSYFKIDNVDVTIPKNKTGSYEDIVIGNEVYGRVLRSHQDVKPIFISCGNYINLQATTKIVLHLINEESRIPIPVRLADLETKRIRRRLVE